MEFTNFPEANTKLTPPAHHDQSKVEIGTINAFFGNNSYGIPVIITCVKIDEEDLEKIKETGKIYIGVMGERFPPMFVVRDSPFKKPENESSSNQ